MDLGQLNTYKTKQNHNANTKKYSDKILFASLNNGLECRKPVFMWASGICFIKWLQFGSICGESNELEYTEGERRYVNLVNKRMGNINMGMYFHAICIMPQGNKKKFVECHSNIF